ncbi:MAG: cytoplasmic protein [Desulfobacteraceae bacterium 4572_19]|nr:MAG: cytoplasmic protein [Desulfobacteraceae bacterium 4572_19]
MAKHSHNFVENYSGIGAFGMDRKSDEETLMVYLQKFSDDCFLNLFLQKASNDDLDEIYTLINKQLKKHLTENEYHSVFLKDR